jgi:pimeloyl-ACP methyl ester carboxylesterase
MMGRPRDDWQAVAQRFADAGITALAIDLPGNGVPGDGPGIEAWRAEVSAAISYLVSRDVGATSVGVAGASLGASLAAFTAAGDGRVRALALVSPVADYKGLRMGAALKQAGGRPVFLLSSRKDPYSARSIREFTKGVESGFETAWSDAPAHGTTLLAREPDLVRLLIEWFQRTLA